MRFVNLLTAMEPAGFGQASWLGADGKNVINGDGSLRLVAPAHSDWFHDPRTLERTRNAPMLLSKVNGPATLKAEIDPAFNETFDAGVLMAYESDEAWAKLCFERAPDGRALVVSVVTRSASDDANAFEVVGGAAHFRISYLGSAYAFHASIDGRKWEMIRHFTLGDEGACRLGVGVQSPRGLGCAATFVDVTLESGAIDDIRSGR